MAVHHISSSQKVEAYARKNPEEYFAEISEAFFSGELHGRNYRNDYYPFEKNHLKEMSYLIYLF